MDLIGEYGNASGFKAAGILFIKGGCPLLLKPRLRLAALGLVKFVPIFIAGLCKETNQLAAGFRLAAGLSQI